MLRECFVKGDVGMNITITGRKVNLKNNFKELVEKKLSRYDRIFEENADAHVVVTVEHNRQTVEITIRQSGLIFRAEATDFEMNDALDQVIGALGRQIRKNKTKLEKKLHSGALRDYVVDYYNGEVPEQPTVEYKIARTKKVPVKPMHIEEAILQMDMLGHQFYMFRDAETEEIAVVYKRHNGGYGLLEPDEDD